MEALHLHAFTGLPDVCHVADSICHTVVLSSGSWVTVSTAFLIKAWIFHQLCTVIYIWVPSCWDKKRGISWGASWLCIAVVYCMGSKGVKLYCHRLLTWPLWSVWSVCNYSVQSITPQRFVQWLYLIYSFRALPKAWSCLSVSIPQGEPIQHDHGVSIIPDGS